MTACRVTTAAAACSPAILPRHSTSTGAARGQLHAGRRCCGLGCELQVVVAYSLVLIAPRMIGVTLSLIMIVVEGQSSSCSAEASASSCRVGTFAVRASTVCSAAVGAACAGTSAA